jgi:2-keto-4-pentenoate hydratase
MARDPRIERGLLAQLTQRRVRIDGGDDSLGWKLGMGTPAAMQKLATTAPLVGYLLESGRVEPGASVPLDGWENPRLEPEIAVHIGADLDGDASREDALTAIAGFGPAMELVDLDPEAADPEPVLAANIFQRHVVLGPVTDGGLPDGVSARVLRDGEEVASADDATEATGDLVDLVLHVARTIALAGERLRAGEVVICGSVVPALEIAPGQSVEVVLDPLGSVTIAFA